MVPAEVAEQDFDRMLEAFELELEAPDDSDEDKADKKDTKTKIVGFIQSGKVTIDDECLPTVHLSIPTKSGEEDVSSVKFHEPTGATLLVIDKHKRNQRIGSMFAMLSDMTGLPAVFFSRLKMRDFKAVQEIGQLFLG